MTYPTSANFKTWAGIAGSGDDTVIGYVLNGAIGWFERRCGKVFVSADATIKWRVADPWVNKKRTRLRTLGKQFTSVTTLTNGDGDVLTADTEYLLYPLSGSPYRGVDLVETSGIRWTDNGSGTPISLRANYGDYSTCPQDVFEGILLLAQADYHARGQGGGGATLLNTQSGLVVAAADIPPRVFRIADEYRR